MRPLPCALRRFRRRKADGEVYRRGEKLEKTDHSPFPRVNRWGDGDSAGGISASPGPPRPGRSAALDLAEWVAGG
ncbi:MAG: hypothetical protein LVS60_13850 [Nodosilinea sp. LVE1205-7]